MSSGEELRALAEAAQEQQAKERAQSTTAMIERLYRQIHQLITSGGLRSTAESGGKSYLVPMKELLDPCTPYLDIQKRLQSFVATHPIIEGVNCEYQGLNPVGVRLRW